MTKRIGTVACMGFVVAFILAVAGFGSASANADPASCRVDHTPGVVTRWEFNHVHRGMTRHQVTCLFGAHGRVTAGHWGSDGLFHEVVLYPALGPHKWSPAAEVQFADTNGYKSTRTFWYSQPTT